MNRSLVIVPLTLLVVACGPTADPPEESMQEAVASEPQSREELAMSAAPAAIGSDATLMDRDEAGELVMLREGTNGWLCVTDENPRGPGEYPICLDGTWQSWFASYQAGEDPQIDEVGMSYMLQGGPAASNTDPMASGPPEGADWLMDGPHIMVIAPDPAMFASYPTDHRVGEPYVMWAGTPYAHLMVPVGMN